MDVDQCCRVIETLARSIGSATDEATKNILRVSLGHHVAYLATFSPAKYFTIEHQ